MDDNAPGWTALDIHWSNLIDSLCNQIDLKNIKTSNKVEKITKTNLDPSLFEIVTEKGAKYYSNKVIIATTISGIKTLVPGASNKNSIYQQIHGQPFLRLYAKFNLLYYHPYHNYIMFHRYLHFHNLYNQRSL